MIKIKKLFALASATAFAGLVSATVSAGCSSTSDAAIGQADATPDGKVKEAGSPVVGSDDGGDTPATCLSTDPIDATQFPYTKAGVTVGACTTKELDDLLAYYAANHTASGTTSIAAWSAVVSEGCAKCVFSDGTGATWTPILTQGDAPVDVDRGGCIEVLSGREECGRTYQQFEKCAVSACAKKCTTPDDFNSCLQDSQSIFAGPCKASFDAVHAACGSKLNTYESGCKNNKWIFEAPIRVQCITGAGKDAGTEDAGDGG